MGNCCPHLSTRSARKSIPGAKMATGVLPKQANPFSIGGSIPLICWIRQTLRWVSFCIILPSREALETIIYLYDVVRVKDKYDLMRFDSSGAVSSGMFDESWRRFVVKMATGTGKTKVMSLVVAWSFFHKLYEPDSELSAELSGDCPQYHCARPYLSRFSGTAHFLF